MHYLPVVLVLVVGCGEARRADKVDETLRQGGGNSLTRTDDRMLNCISMCLSRFEVGYGWGSQLPRCDNGPLPATSVVAALEELEVALLRSCRYETSDLSETLSETSHSSRAEGY